MSIKKFTLVFNFMSETFCSILFIIEKIKNKKRPINTENGRFL